MRNIMKLIVTAALLAIGVNAALAINMDQGGAASTPTVNPHAMPAPAESAIPGTGEPLSRAAFENAVQLDAFRLLAIQHNDQVKILDSWARQSLSAMRHRQSINGQDPLFTALDMAVRPGAWMNQNIIYIQAIPIRQDLMNLAPDKVESERILHEGLVSPAFLNDMRVIKQLETIELDVRRADAVRKVMIALNTFNTLGDTLHVVPPTAANRGSPWLSAEQLMGNLPADLQQQLGVKDKIPAPGYTGDQALKINLAYSQLLLGWRGGDPELTNTGIKSLCEVLPTIDPDGYPSHAKRVTELWYNRTFFGTVANVFLYFIAMTLFLIVAVGAAKKVEKPALVVFTIAVAIHFASMAVRYWLAGRWPTQNQFESVLGAALLGCIVGWFLETKKRNGLFGMAFSFVGFLAMTACMTAPYVFGRDIGGTIGKTAGILSTYWLYIHVNVVISSYALIGASFALGITYLGAKLWFWINPLEPGFDADESEPLSSGDGRTGNGGTTAVATPALADVSVRRTALLETLDQANMVVLQMAFWFLGIGIICGAIWADQSWGRPWGWDPKETFALVTWIVYLIIVHARFVTGARKDLTAWLSVVGFAVMMFNWIGVNFFLAGLHSYA